jgi:hypothetical protein
MEDWLGSRAGLDVVEKRCEKERRNIVLKETNKWREG